MNLSVPDLSLVVLIGPSGPGKSTFAGRHFKPTEVLSSDFCRGLVADDESAQAASADAFDILYAIAGKRLSAGRLTVVDATSVRPEDRKPLVQLAKQHHALPVAVMFNLPEKVCQERNRLREDRNFGPHVIRGQRTAMRRSLRGLKREGFRHIYTFESPEQVDAAVIQRVPLYNNLKHEHGPFDIIGDVHGCCDELEELLSTLGYLCNDMGYSHPLGRKAIFLGDLVDRGPRILDTLKLVMSMCAAGTALCVPGNHDMKFLRKLRGKDVKLTHGLAQTMAELDRLPEGEREATPRCIADFLDDLVSHYVLDDGRLVVAHAGMKAEMQGRGSGRVHEFALYGETTGETDEFGLPIRYNWAAEYRGKAMVVHGHTPVPQPEWLNRTINIDTGCVFGGRLTALRYPESELISVPAKRTYAESRRPFPTAEQQLAAARAGLSAQQIYDDVLDIGDLLGKRIIETRLLRNVTISEAHGAAALEAMSRFAIDPKWLIYLPPTMSPCETSSEKALLEHPREALEYFRRNGQRRAVCEQKHMGSRAIVIVCRDEMVPRRRFGVAEEGIGIIYTRTGRRFFEDREVDSALLRRVQGALASTGFFDTFQTDWACLDCELMPWSAKAQALLEEQYAAVGAAARAALPEVIEVLRRTTDAGRDASTLLPRHEERLELANRYTRAYQQYCWLVRSVEDLQLAPFHLLATERKVHVDQPHTWHMETLANACSTEKVLLATPYRVVDLHDEAGEREAINWWRELTDGGGEGMVVKPLDFVVTSRKGLVQPAVKCRGPEYLRIIYGPEYTLPEHLGRLRERGLGRKRSLALREFALGVESLERFVRREPLRRVHECVFGVLALESEPIDPRL